MDYQNKIIKNNIVLIGFMGTGKTSVAKILSTKLNKKLIDTDRIIEQYENKTINKIFENYGEKYFRSKETEVIFSFLKAKNIILSCGGGVILKEENINYLKKIGKVFCLVSSPQIIYNRIKKDNTRPILNNNMNIKYIHKIIQSRQEKYKKASDFTIINENKSIYCVADEIIKTINFWR